MSQRKSSQHVHRDLSPRLCVITFGCVGACLTWRCLRVLLLSFCPLCPRLWMYLFCFFLLSKIFNMYSLIFYLGSDYQFAALGRHFVPLFLALERSWPRDFKASSSDVSQTRNACFVRFFLYRCACMFVCRCCFLLCSLLLRPSECIVSLCLFVCVCFCLLLLFFSLKNWHLKHRNPPKPFVCVRFFIVLSSVYISCVLFCFVFVSSQTGFLWTYFATTVFFVMISHALLRLFVNRFNKHLILRFL